MPASQPAAVRWTASQQQHPSCQAASQPASSRSTASQPAAACSQPASEPASSSSSKAAASQSVSQSASSQPASQPPAAPAASQPASRPAAEPASLSTALFFAALLCSTSPPAETRLTVCRRSQHNLLGSKTRTSQHTLRVTYNWSGSRPEAVIRRRRRRAPAGRSAGRRATVLAPR